MKQKVFIPVDDIVELVRGQRVGVLTNGSYWIEEADDDIVGVVKKTSKETVLLYGEHGPRGDDGACEPAGETMDSYTGCRARNLYHYNVEKSAVADLDLIVVGLPDIGCRHYSYKRTMCGLMELASNAGKPVAVADMPNPVRGDLVEGNFPDAVYFENMGPKYSWFAAPITYRHGMTMGELALMAKDRLNLHLDLRIIKMDGWRRDMWWEDTGWLYMPMDPSIYRADTTLAFLCTGLFQGTSVSWGIGTSDPFGVIGAPWIEDDKLLSAMRERSLAGITWSRAHFIPRWKEKALWGRFAGECCHGIRMHITDRDKISTSEIQLSLLVECLRLYPDKFDFCDPKFIPNNYWLDKRLEDEQWSRRLKAGEGVETILHEWKQASGEFKKNREKYLLY